MQNNKQVFTLIELLIVVLIIGVLSAIALPQYTVAVEKARASEAVQNAAQLQRAIDIYIMENGFPNNTVDFLTKGGNGNGVLAVDLENVLTGTEGNFSHSKHFVYQATCSTE